MGLPAGVALLLGFETEMLLITGGSFAVIYGEGRPFRTRWRVMVIAGLLLALGQMAGATVGSVVWPQIDAGGSQWWLMLIAVFATTVAAVVVFVQNALRLPPPGGFFLVMVSGGASMVAKQGLNPVEVGCWALIGAATATAIGMAPALWGRRRPETSAVERLEAAVAAYAASPVPSVAQTHQVETQLVSTWNTLFDAGRTREDELVQRTLAAHVTLARSNPTLSPAPDSYGDVTDTPNYLDLSRHAVPLPIPTMRYRLFRSLHRYSRATMATAKVTVACLCAGTVGIAFGFDRPDWSVLSAMLVLQWAPERVSGTIRGLHRLIGSVVGVGVFAVFHLLGVHGWTLLVTLAACQFCTEIFVVKNYALTVVASTPLALLMGGTIHLPLGEVIISRWAEIGVATVFSLGVLWLFPRSAAIRHAEMLIDRSVDAMGALLGALLTTGSAQGALVQRRDLQYELLSERQAALTVALDSPDFAADNWPQHLRTQRAGYHVLDACTSAGDREITAGEVAELSADVRDARMRRD
ncbi:hypothetical protein A606_08965 [Corynebacterium terpenotabidum Y-11]|uniref:Integral membrane bound transporter domain-containing protein n=2 Tax=Corynebacterium terpenotabidum TaxID=89154 RepID=S4XFS5_9CORY|nr:hypothetical protein A606_08965 [Corynebacterium terpenotabidum Y-11]